MARVIRNGGDGVHLEVQTTALDKTRVKRVAHASTVAIGRTLVDADGAYANASHARATKAAVEDLPSRSRILILVPTRASRTPSVADCSLADGVGCRSGDLQANGKFPKELLLFQDHLDARELEDT
jgi:hypothetical protein